MKYTAAILALAAIVAAQDPVPTDTPVVGTMPTDTMMTGGGGDSETEMQTSMQTDSSMMSSMTESTPTPTPTTISSVITSGDMTSTLVETSQVTPSQSDGAAPTAGPNYIAPVMGIAAAVAML